MAKKILITGAAGYIGSVLVRQLLAKGYAVRGLDVLSFGGESLLGVYNNPNFEFLKGDIRDVNDLARALEGVGSVVHLAAIVGDPACAKQADLAREVNLEASKRLFELCLEKGVSRFVFASTCSNYGKMDDGNCVDENSPLRPVSLYAELKVAFEKFISEHRSTNGLSSTVLRFATVYGPSARMRFDLTVNEFVREAALGKELEVYGEQFWRPYCHVEDIARAIILVLESSREKVSSNVFGVGNSDENYQKKMIVDEITKIVPTGKFQYVHKDEDPRDYKVDFSRIGDELGFSITRTVPDGIREISSMLKDDLFLDPYSQSYTNS